MTNTHLLPPRASCSGRSTPTLEEQLGQSLILFLNLSEVALTSGPWGPGGPGGPRRHPGPAGLSLSPPGCRRLWLSYSGTGKTVSNRRPTPPNLWGGVDAREHSRGRRASTGEAAEGRAVAVGPPSGSRARTWTAGSATPRLKGDRFRPIAGRGL